MAIGQLRETCMHVAARPLLSRCNLATSHWNAFDAQTLENNRGFCLGRSRNRGGSLLAGSVPGLHENSKSRRPAAGFRVVHSLPTLLALRDVYRL